MPAIQTRKEQIQEVAQQLFKENGYKAASMRQLAAALGIEAASIYTHVKSKEAILRSICFDLASEFFNYLEKAKLNHTKPSELLKAMLEGHIRVVLKNRNASAVFFNDWKFLSEPSLGEFKQLRKNYELEFRKVILTGTEKGDFKCANVEFATLGMFATLNVAHEWNLKSRMTTKEVSEQLTHLIIYGIK